MRIFTLATATWACAMLLTGCDTDTPSIALPASSASPTTTPEEPCARPSPSASDSPEDKLLTAELKDLDLPGRSCLFAVVTYEGLGAPNTLDVHIDLNVPDSTGPDSVRSAATDVAHALKRSELGPKIHEVVVTDWGIQTPKAPTTKRHYLRDAAFNLHPWDGTPSREAELAIWVEGVSD